MNQDIVTLLSAPGRIVNYSYELLDYQENVKNVQLKVKRAKIRYSSLDDIKQYAEITMLHDDNIDYDNDLIKVYCNIYILGQGTFSYSLGIYMMVAPLDDIDRNVTYNTINCYGKNQFLADEIINEAYRLPAGASVREAIISLLDTHRYSLPDSMATMPTNRDFGSGNTKLGLINTLLSDYMKCTSLYVSPEGVYTARAYVEPANRVVDHTHDYTKMQIEAKMTRERDISRVPNRFNSYTSSSQEESLYYSYTNNNVESRTSTVNRHGRIIDEKQVLVDCSTIAELEAATKKRANEASTAYEKVKWNTKVLPIHGFMDCCLLNTPKVQGKFIETSWSIDTSTDSMEHNGRKVVAV